MSLNPQDLTEQRMLALAKALMSTVRTQHFLVTALTTGRIERSEEALRDLKEAESTLYTYFLGD